MRSWLLPEYIEDLLPDEALRVEHLRRALLDHFIARGYRLVQPPLVEHLDALTTGTGRDLELQTFKVVDPMSGRMLGVRSDITPQVARLDAHVLNEAGVTRLCYAGSVLHTLPSGPGSTREIVQIGAELFGEAGIAGDQEAIALLLSALGAVGVARRHLDLGHAAVYRALVNAAGLAGGGDEADLFDAVRTKDAPGVAALAARLPRAWRDALCALPTLYGPADEVLARARNELLDTPAIANALSALATVSAHAAGDVDGLHIDLADLRGYHYHNGITFEVFTAGEAGAIGKGGRYDGVGKAFGRARPATGFTLDLRQLADVVARTH
ncbi:MAG: ATP phosphoribosyltransferase regulatory subunit [Proteobacteria bacterium]|nr:ATP phosphoribosyltransferase regulatory subunit [Pseudomonadota bacterium]